MSPAPATEKLARQALRQASAALELAQAQRQPLAISLCLADMARCCRCIHQMASAETYFEQALIWARVAGSNDQVVDLLCELCDTAARVAADCEAVQAGAGDAARERMRDHAFEASALANRVADRGWEAQVLLRVSDVFDRCGDRDDAVVLQTRAYRLMSGSLAGSVPDPRLLPSLGRLADA